MPTCNESSMRWKRSSNVTASTPNRTRASNSPPDLSRLFRSPSSEPTADRSPADRQHPLAAKLGEQAADRLLPARQSSPYGLKQRHGSDAAVQKVARGDEPVVQPSKPTDRHQLRLAEDVRPRDDGRAEHLRRE